MKSLSLLGLATPFIGMAQAHTLFTTLYVNDAKQGDGTCVRETPDKEHPTFPVLDVTSDDITCGFGGNTPVAYTCPAPAGAKLTFEYRLSPDKADYGFLDPSHKGPAAVYAKQLSSADETASGPGWFKIWGEGYDADADKWATEKIIDTNGLLSINIPSALPAGNWLFRPEIVAMHNTTPAVEPQFYVGCAQVFIESSVTETLSVPTEKSVSIPGYLQANDKSVTYNIYDEEEYATPKVPYPMMGPEPFVPAAVSTASSGKVVTQSKGGVPDTCLLKNANWCGVEVPSYSDQKGCWAAVDACWAQNDECWDAAPPSGGRNCDVWRTKCDDLDSHCKSGDFNGPSTFGLKSNDWPAKDCPAAMNAGDVPDTPSQTTSSSTSGASSTAAEETSPVATSETTATGGPATIAHPTTTLATLPVTGDMTATYIEGASSTDAVGTTPSSTSATAASAPSAHCKKRRSHKKRHSHQRRQANPHMRQLRH